MIWHDVPQFPNYQATKCGLIRKKVLVAKGNNQLTLSQSSDGAYLGVKMKDESGVWKRVKVHVAVMLTFVGPRPEGLVINHIDGDKTNNALDNLEYCTQLANEHHSLTVLGKTHLRGPDGRFITSTI